MFTKQLISASCFLPARCQWLRPRPQYLHQSKRATSHKFADPRRFQIVAASGRLGGNTPTVQAQEETAMKRGLFGGEGGGR